MANLARLSAPVLIQIKRASGHPVRDSGAYPVVQKLLRGIHELARGRFHHNVHEALQVGKILQVLPFA